MAACKRRRTDLNLAQKKEVCAYKETNPKATQDSIASLFSRKWDLNIARRTVGNILERKADWDSIDANKLKAKRARKPKFAVLEEALAMWFSTMQAKKAVVTDAVLIEKGKQFAERLHCEDFMPSGGWMSRFKSRHGISMRNLHGEAASVDVSVVATARTSLKETLAQYQPEDIYNIDKTGLFYRMPPSKSLTQGPQHGTKQFKDRITIALCVNADGTDYLKPLVIGKSANPRCFKDFNKDAYVQYFNSQKAWMTGYLFGEWLHHFDRHIKQKKNRPVLLLLDNVASHFPDVQLECVKLCHLPPNTTSHLQPLDAGIIRAFKAHYRSRQVKRYIDLIEKDQKPDLNLKEAIRLLAAAWRSVTPSTISNCWIHTGILPTTSPELGDQCEDPVEELSAVLDSPQLRSAGCLSADSYLEQDQTVDTGEMPREDDILSLVSSQPGDTYDSDSGDEPEVVPQPAPSSRQAVEAVRLLQDFFDSKDSEEGSSALIGVDKLVQQLSEQSQVQSSIFDFFKRT